MPTFSLPALLRTLAVWLLLMAAEAVQGTLRRALDSEDAAFLVRQVSVVTGAAIIFAITWFCMRWMEIRTTRGALAVGALWVMLTIAFEFGLGRATGASWRQMLVDYDLLHGGLMPLGLLAMGLTPWAVRRLRHLEHVIAIKAAFPPDG
jgi:hypothetical protein